VSKFLSEIRRRRVVQTFVPYLGFVWLLLQIVSVITPALNWHPLVNTFFAIVLFAGIPVMLYLSWYFDFTPQGLVATPELESGEVQPFGVIRWSFLLVITASSGLLGYQYYHNLKTEFSKSQEGIIQTITADSIAVLPFDDNSPDQDQGYIAQGLAEEITSLLGRIQGLTVAASSSSAILKDKGLDPVAIARRLNVDTVLTGSVRMVGDKLTVRAELINAVDGKVIWSESFARKFTDIFAVETEIARSTVNILQDNYIESGTLTNSALTNSTDAYVMYLKGREQYRNQTTESMKEARKLFEQAIGLDPEYAQAYVALADTIVLLAEGEDRFGILKVDIAAKLAEQYLEKALIRDARIPEAYGILGYVSRLNQNYVEAIERFDKALSLNPNMAVIYNWKFLVYREMGKQVESFDSAIKAYDLDPISLVSQHNYGFALSIRGKYEEATLIFKQLIKVHPNSPLGYAGLGDIEFGLGNYANSLKYWRKAHLQSPNNLSYKNSMINCLYALGMTKQLRLIVEDKSIETSILLLEGRYAELFEEIEFQIAANPDDPWLVFEAGWYQSLIGNKELGIKQLILSKPNFSDEDMFSMPWCSPAIEIAWALQSTGELQEAQKIIKRCEKQLLNAQKKDINQHELDYLAARIAALSSNPKKAIEYLSIAVKNGWREWWTDKDPLFIEFQSNPKLAEQTKLIHDDLAKQKEEALKLFEE
jgi:TolB-like protein/tetratricopeptide (TPR) repeat protein